MVKRILILCFLIAFGLGFVSGAQAEGKIKIGIIPSSNQPNYLEGLQGILSQLKKEGFDESNVDFDIRHGENKAEKIAEIAREFVQKKMNVVITIGTVAAIAACKEIKDIPVVCSNIFDPIGSGIAKSWESSGRNVTGSSSWVNMSSMVKLLRKIGPAKRIGVIYTEKELQTVLQLNEFKKIQEKMDFLVVPAELSKPEDAAAVTNALVGKVDSIFTTGGTVVSDSLAVIVAVAKKSKILTLTHLPDRVERGVLLSMGADRVQLGEVAGKKAAQVLHGANPAFMPIETLEYYDITVNLQTAKEMGLEIPDSMLKSAKKIIQ